MADSRISFLAFATVIVVAGLVLRTAGAGGDLWLDEIWTLSLLADRAPTPFHVFWSVQHDNSHTLYAFYAWFLPEEEGEFGRCEECGKPIPEERLMVIPEATLCVPCQRELEEMRF